MICGLILYQVISILIEIKNLGYLLKPVQNFMNDNIWKLVLSEKKFVTTIFENFYR